MKLTELQINEYNENGFLIIDALFSEEEIVGLRNGILKIDDKPIPNIIREENGDIRSVFAPHHIKEEFSWLYKQDRLVTPAQQLLNDDAVYLYQYKLNNKKAFKGGLWEWHQDFPYWHIDDGVKKPQMLSVMILFQDTDYVQGPLMFIPKSHKTGIADFQPKEHLTEENTKLENSLNGDLKFTIKNELINKMVDQKPDNIYASPLDRVTDFAFDDAVARVFPDMIQRSVPGYTTIIPMIGLITERYAKPGTYCYDLGCSLGASTLAMRHGLKNTDCTLIAIDNSDAMVRRCEHYIELDNGKAPVDLRCGDIRHTNIENASIELYTISGKKVKEIER